MLLNLHLFIRKCNRGLLSLEELDNVLNNLQDDFRLYTCKRVRVNTGAMYSTEYTNNSVRTIDPEYFVIIICNDTATLYNILLSCNVLVHFRFFWSALTPTHPCVHILLANMEPTE